MDEYGSFYPDPPIRKGRRIGGVLSTDPLAISRRERYKTDAVYREEIKRQVNLSRKRRLEEKSQEVIEEEQLVVDKKSTQAGYSNKYYLTHKGEVRSKQHIRTEENDLVDRMQPEIMELPLEFRRELYNKVVASEGPRFADKLFEGVEK